MDRKSVRLSATHGEMMPSVVGGPVEVEKHPVVVDATARNTCGAPFDSATPAPVISWPHLPISFFYALAFILATESGS